MKQKTFLNLDVYKLERKFTRKVGLPNRSWYRHRVYAPGYYLGYGTQVLPGINEALLFNNFDVALKEAKLFEEIIDELIQEIQNILKLKLGAK